MKAKSVLCLILAFALVVSLAACGGKKKKDNNSSQLSSSSMPEVTQTPTPEPMAKAVRVTAVDGLNVREAPSTDSEVLGLAANNSRLPLLRETELDGWYQIEYKGETAYVFAEYATVIEVTQTEYEALRSGSAATASPDPSSDKTTDDGDTPDPSAADAEPTASPEPDKSPEPTGLNNQDGE